MPPKSKLAACMYCRQMKLKCDAHDLFPASCSRCEKQGLRCSIDPTFRRTAKRERVKALEQEVERLQCSRGATGSTESPEDIHEPPVVDSIAIPQSIESPVINLQWTLQAQKVGDVEVGEPMIRQLFEEYYAECHDRFPIISGRDTVAQWYTCPLLLGAILCIASEHKPQYAPLRDKLVPEVQRLAMDHLEAIRNPCATVQALLLLCWWPLSLDASVTNPSWSYCGLATHTALQFGLHRPQFSSDYRYRDFISEEAVAARRRTWLACFVVNQSISTYLGVPSTTPIDHTILSAVGTPDPSLPLILQQYLEIAYHDYQMCQALGNHGLSPSGQRADPVALVSAYDRDLQSLHMKHSQDWSNSTEIAFLKARLNLYSFACSAIFDKNAKRNRPEPLNTTIIAEAEHCAERIIELAAQDQASIQRWSTDIRCALTWAIFILLKLAASKHEAVNQHLAKESVRQAWELYSKASSRKTDQYARICSIMEYLSGPGGQDEAYATSMSVHSRMASNIFYDTAWAARARFPKHIREMRPVDYTAYAEDQERAIEMDLNQNGNLLDMDDSLIADLFGADLLGWDFDLQGK